MWNQLVKPIKSFLSFLQSYLGEAPKITRAEFKKFVVWESSKYPGTPWKDADITEILFYFNSGIEGFPLHWEELSTFQLQTIIRWWNEGQGVNNG
jgi:hypothetical protein